MLLLIGAGEGCLLVDVGENCDYTIGCNRKWIELDGCTNMEEAMTMARLMLVPTGDPNHETAEDLKDIKSGRILEIADSRLVDIRAWKDDKQADDDDREKTVAYEKDIRLIKALKEKYPEEF